MRPGDAIGRYRIAGELGRGGMGVVYHAIDPELDRPVALKVIRLPPDAAPELRDELEKRFRREAKAAARIRHPGVVAIHDWRITRQEQVRPRRLAGDDAARHTPQTHSCPARG